MFKIIFLKQTIFTDFLLEGEYNMPIHQTKKLNKMKQVLNNKYYEREEEIEGILLALLSKQHMLMIGPAGTAKSALAMEVSKLIEGTSYFQWLLTKFSAPEELFGPLSLNDLEHGKYKRITKNKMPEAQLVFLDEIFKANSAILNSMLTLMNERIFYNDANPTRSPLLSVIAASNELSEEDELNALSDRFLLKYETNFIAEEKNFIAMMNTQMICDDAPLLTIEELIELQEVTTTIKIPKEVVTILSKIRMDLRDEGIHPSDRKFKQSLSILQAKALIEERSVVEVEDLLVLVHVLWNTLDQKKLVSSIIYNQSNHFVKKELFTIRNEANEIYYALLQNNSTDIRIEMTHKMKTLVSNLIALKEHYPSQTKEIDEQLTQILSMQHEALDTILEPWSTQSGSKESTSIFFKI